MRLQIIHTSAGLTAAAWTKGKLLGLTLPHENLESAADTLKGYLKLPLFGMLPLLEQIGPCQQLLARDLERYFSGEAVSFDVPLDWERVTPFQQRVLKVVAEIPYGQSLSYGEVAQMAGCPRGARAVGGAVGANPWVLVVPCHRVLAYGHGLGGFGCGLAWKEKLLQMENITYQK